MFERKDSRFERFRVWEFRGSNDIHQSWSFMDLSLASKRV